MKTELTRSPEVAASYIRKGGVVAFPTETVYGLGAGVFNEQAINKIFEAKQRPADNPLIAHVGAVEQIAPLTSEIPDSARRFIERFFPGPLTVVLERSERVPLIATAGLDTIGIRMPGHPTANEFLRACGAPVVAPSANLSGRPSPTTWQAVQEDLDGRIDCILQGDKTRIGLESTVVDCTVDPPLILRTGAVTVEELHTCVQGTTAIGRGEIEEARSPGMRHRHYSPSGRVVLSDAWHPKDTASKTAFIGLSEPAWSPQLSYVAASVDDYAHEMFEFFRECDRQGITTIVCQSVEESGIGTALMDRLRRAAER